MTTTLQDLLGFSLALFYGKTSSPVPKKGKGTKLGTNSYFELLLSKLREMKWANAKRSGTGGDLGGSNPRGGFSADLDLLELAARKPGVCE